ncbi:hypothetical protein DUNSADRAFT_12135 [Dunaliella salina]|uniref:SAC3/GANP/THP3 conserved domain-containing protein n=1 Tax=Dunaliella salina TaxID=3046 RepID=A0ABQ7GBY8_DUNSA|nr:hypothetical protein DUNSADRAFT_12135 [Dunaliella salina]|eukprot:KAF5832124.1 hypothetical protein DUNSADRAFT_12135 [Dunaliella salina]
MLFGVPVGNPPAAPSPATSPFGVGFGQQQQQQQQQQQSSLPLFGQPAFGQPAFGQPGFPPSSQRKVFGVPQGSRGPAGGTGHPPAFGAGIHQEGGRPSKQQQQSPPAPQFGQPSGVPPSTSPPARPRIVFGLPQGSQGPADGTSPPLAFRAGAHREGGGQPKQQQQESGKTEQPAEIEDAARRVARMHRFGKGAGASNGKNDGIAPLSKQQQRKQQRQQQQQQKQEFGGTGEPIAEDEAARRNARLSRFGQGAAGAAGAAAGSGAESAGGDGEDEEMAPPPFRPPFGGDSGLGGRAMDEDVDGAGIFVVGTCEDMCPEEERQTRARNGELHPFERVQYDNAKLTSRDLIVTRFVKNYAQEQQIPPNFRTLGALDKTMRHLRRIMDWTTKDHPSAEPIVIYEFLWDRYRVVRKEIVTQRFNTSPANLPQVLAWNEEVARYFIACSHELINTKGFSAFLNHEQLNKVLMDLLSDYRTCVDLGVPTPCAGEFKCYMAIMTYFGIENKSGKKIPNKIGAFEVLRSFTAQEQEDSWFPVTLGILTALANMDVHAYIQLAKAAPYPLACVLFMHYGDMKEHGFRITPHAYNASADPENVVPIPALAHMFDLTTRGISMKCASMGATLGPYPEDPSIEAVRWETPECS